MNKDERKKAIQELKTEADDKYGEAGWVSATKVFSLPGGDSESLRVLNSRRQTEEGEGEPGKAT